ncbi:hypothetical protein [Halalkalibacter flavus]
MNKKNMRKNSRRVCYGYLTAKERKIVKWYEQQREKQRNIQESKA